MEEQSKGGFAQASEIRIVLRADTSLIEAKLAEAREAAFRAAALHLEAHRLPPTLEGLAAELRGLAHDVGLSPALAEQVDSVLARFERAMARLEQLSSLLTEEVARRAAEGPRPRIVPGDDIKARGLLTLNLQALGASAVWLGEAQALARLGAGEGLGFVHPAMGLDLPDTPDALTLTPADLARLKAAEELRATLRAKVEAAHTAGRRVNVLELGSREHALLGLGRLTSYPLRLAGEQIVQLAVRVVEAHSALSVLYDPEA